MSTLDERRRKPRRKGTDATAGSVATSDAPAAAAGASPAAADAAADKADKPEKKDGASDAAGAGTPGASVADARARNAERQAALDSINFAAYLRHAASQSPDQRALACAERGLTGGLVGDSTWTSLSVRELDERSDALARGFAAAGWSRGQRVIILSEPSIDALSCVLALVKMGAVPVVIEPGRTREDIAECAQQARASVVLGSPAGLVKRFVARGPFKDAKTTVLIGAELPLPMPGVKALASLRSSDASRVPLAPTRPAEPAMILFSSGAAGPSRAVVLDHATLIAQAESLRRSQGLNPAEIVLCDDLLLSMLLVVIGKTAIVPGISGSSAKFAEKLLACMDQHAPTTVVGAPPLMRAVAEHCTRIGRMLPNVRQVLLVGGPASLATHQAVQAVLPSGECRSIYSMTEGFPLAVISARDAFAETSAVTERGGGLCLGRVLTGVDVAVLDFGRGGGTPVDSGELGEICVKGARVAPSEARAAGPWTRTGDIGWIDRAGRLWLVGSVRRSAHTRFGPIYDTAGEALFEMHPRVRRAVIVPLGSPGQQEAVLVVQAPEGRHPKDEVERGELERELLHAAESHQVTRGIRRVVFRKELPTDARFGAQAMLPELAKALQA